MEEKAIKEFVDAVFTAIEKAEVAAVVTGDIDFRLVAAAMTTLVAAQAKGDLDVITDAMADAISKILEARTGRNNATSDLLRNIGLN